MDWYYGVHISITDKIAIIYVLILYIQIAFIERDCTEQRLSELQGQYDEWTVVKLSPRLVEQ